jgi:hypothetical protein
VVFAALEQTITDSGDPQRVIAMRENFQRVMADRSQHIIKELTGRNVLAFVSRVNVEPDITIETCFIDGSLRGLAHPNRRHRNRRPGSWTRPRDQRRDVLARHVAVTVGSFPVSRRSSHG